MFLSIKQRESRQWIQDRCREGKILFYIPNYKRGVGVFKVVFRGGSVVFIQT